MHTFNGVETAKDGDLEDTRTNVEVGNKQRNDCAEEGEPCPAIPFGIGFRKQNT